MSTAGLQVGKLRSMNYRWDIKKRLKIKFIANEIFNEEHISRFLWLSLRLTIGTVTGLFWTSPVFPSFSWLGLATFLLNGSSEVATWSFEGPLTLDLRLTSWISSLVGKLSPRTLWPMAAWTSVDVRLLNLTPQIWHFIESEKKRNMFSLQQKHIFFKCQKSGK